MYYFHLVFSLFGVHTFKSVLLPRWREIGRQGKEIHGGKYTRRQCLAYTYFRLPCVCKLLPLHLLYMFEGRVDEGREKEGA